jgi:hypothetical protein
VAGLAGNTEATSIKTINKLQSKRISALQAGSPGRDGALSTLRTGELSSTLNTSAGAHGFRREIEKLKASLATIQVRQDLGYDHTAFNRCARPKRQGMPSLVMISLCLNPLFCRALMRRTRGMAATTQQLILDQCEGMLKL